jgi:hypothetical protein
MSWQVSLMSDWTAAGGEPLHDLGPTHKGTTIQFELSGQGEATLVLDAEIAYALATQRQIVRVDRPTGGFFDFRITHRSRKTLGAEGSRFTVRARPRVYAERADGDAVHHVGHAD